MLDWQANHILVTGLIISNHHSLLYLFRDVIAGFKVRFPWSIGAIMERTFLFNNVLLHDYTLRGAVY